ncbi:MAG: hypothetical protein OEQ53_19740, partial [Saprospiraceae bacterium]|nr:hypothetical protein [Saprospiraceae bacterium]
KTSEIAEMEPLGALNDLEPGKTQVVTPLAGAGRDFMVVAILPILDIDKHEIVHHEDVEMEPIADISDELKIERTRVGKLLAGINLMPSGLRDLDKEEIKDKVMPEFFASRD